MEIQRDYKEWLELLNANKVEYLIVGAFALAYHGIPRFTGDLDILVHPEINNAKRIISVLDKLGFGSLGIKESDLTKPDYVIQLGVAPIRLDIITSLTGVTWEEAVSGRVHGLYDNVPIYYLGRKQLIANKKALGRTKDLADIEALEKLR